MYKYIIHNLIKLSIAFDLHFEKRKFMLFLKESEQSIDIFLYKLLCY